MKWFGQVIIGAGVNPGHFLVPVVARGENQYRHASPGGPPFLQNGEPIHLRQAQIENNCIKRLALVDRLPMRIDSIVRHIDRIPGSSQCLAELCRNAGLILNNQNAHSSVSPDQ
jgi:hypothetical protein